MWQTELWRAAEQQHGVISRQQIRLDAPSRSAARHEIERGRWRPAGANALVAAGSPPTLHQKLMTAVLNAGPGAIVSHESAAALWEVPGFNLVPPHVTILRASAVGQLDGVIVHEVRQLAADQVTTIDRLPVTRPERVPFDLANTGLAAKRIERVVDRLWSDRLVSGRSLRRVKRSLPLRGFRGTALMRELLDARGDDWVPPASGLESRAMELFDRNHFNGFERQVDLGGDDWVGRVDFINRRHRVVVEVQSDRHHAALSSRRDDAARFGRLGRAGFTVVEVWEDELWHRPGAFLERLRRTLASQNAQLPPAEVAPATLAGGS